MKRQISSRVSVGRDSILGIMGCWSGRWATAEEVGSWSLDGSFALLEKAFYLATQV